MRKKTVPLHFEKKVIGTADVYEEGEGTGVVLADIRITDHNTWAKLTNPTMEIGLVFDEAEKKEPLWSWMWRVWFITYAVGILLICFKHEGWI